MGTAAPAVQGKEDGQIHQRGVELLGFGRLLRRFAPIEKTKRVARDSVRRRHHRLSRGDGEQLGAVRMIARRFDRQHPQPQVLAIAVETGLCHALQGQVRQAQLELDRLLVGERHTDVPDFTDALSEGGAWIGSGMRAVRPGFQDGHGVASVGHDQMQAIEREVRCYQRRTTSRSRTVHSVRHDQLTSGRIRAVHGARGAAKRPSTEGMPEGSRLR